MYACRHIYNILKFSLPLFGGYSLTIKQNAHSHTEPSTSKVLSESFLVLGIGVYRY